MYRGIPVWLRVVQALHNAPRADDTLWGPGIFTSIEAMPFPVADEDYRFQRARFLSMRQSWTATRSPSREASGWQLFRACRSNEKPGCGVARKPGFPFSGSVIAERWLLEMARHPRCVRGRTNQPRSN